jgi:hypothetical protein
MLSRGVEMLAAKAEANMAVTIKYKRGDSSVDIAATPGMTTTTQDDGAGMSIEAHVKDWLLSAASLVLDGERTKPLRGDVIRADRPDGEGVDVYEVAGPAGAMHYDEILLGRMYRVHVRKIGEDTR